MASSRKIKDHFQVNVSGAIVSAVMAALILLGIKQVFRMSGKGHLAGDL